MARMLNGARFLAYAREQVADAEWLLTAHGIDSVLAWGITDGVAPIVRALAAEHRAMDAGQPPHFAARPVALVTAADKIVAFGALMRRAEVSGDPLGFWRRRAALRRLLPYSQAWSDLRAPLLPPPMSAELRAAGAEVKRAMTSRTVAPLDKSGPTEPQWLVRATNALTRSGLCGERRGPFSGGDL